MDKIDHKSRNILGGNVEKIAELFPGVVTEAQDEVTGELKKVVDFDLLRQHLSDELVEGDRERFRLDWPGKRASMLKANTPISKTLRPVREDSVDFDTTQNVFIEGDNFEVLKVLQESYLGKIKMIYIDPPYNTGKDFIYKDNFAADREDYEEEIGVRDDENGGKLVKNTETNGRYHSDWLSMMQERLIVARDLLTDDGVMFVSIDDNEQGNLKKLCDEVFGEENFIANVVWQNKEGGGGSDSKMFKVKHEYTLVYSRSVDYATIYGDDVDNEARYTESDEYVETRGKHLLIRLESGSIQYSESLNYPITTPEGIVILPNKDGTNNKCWRWSKAKVDWGVENGYVVFKKGGDGEWAVYTKQYLNADNSGNIIDRKKAPLAVVDKYSTTQSAKELIKLFEGKKYFDYPKPTEYIKWLVSKVADRDSIVLDFFSGSGTTAHAVMQLNAEDGGNRRHIQVQLAEPTDEKSEAYKAGYKSIPEISRERIRRAAKKIREDYAEQITKRDTPLDTGFRAYKLASSNFVDTAQHPAQTTQASLLDVTDNIKESRTAEDLLTEVILDLGLTLDLPIEQRDIAGHSVFFVGGNSLVACFDDKVSLDIVDGIAAEKPLRVVFKDSSFANDETRINIDIRLKQLSPDTTVQVV